MESGESRETADVQMGDKLKEKSTRSVVRPGPTCTSYALSLHSTHKGKQWIVGALWAKQKDIQQLLQMCFLTTRIRVDKNYEWSMKRKDFSLIYHIQTLF